MRIVWLLVVSVTIQAQAHYYRRPIVRHYIWNGSAVGYGVQPIWPLVQYGFSFNPYHYFAAHASFGAIAYSPATQKAGYSSGHRSRTAASAAAEAFCGAPDCRMVVWVNSGCAAISTSRETHSLGWAYAKTRDRAIHFANYACRQHGGLDCDMRAWVCSW